MKTDGKWINGRKLFFATNNQLVINKRRMALPGDFEIVTLKEAGINRDIPEPHETLEANAEEKAAIYHRTVSGGNLFDH